LAATNGEPAKPKVVGRENASGFRCQSQDLMIGCAGADLLGVDDIEARAS
jgi:hypothetical protein